MVASLDAAVGRVLKALEASGRAGDTIIVFTSDNGGERYSYHWPFRGEKGSLWEGGIRVPAIVVWPRVLAAGKVVEPARDEHGLASDAAVGSRREARSRLSGGWHRSHARPPRPYTGVRAHGVLAHAGHDGCPQGRLEVRSLGHARVPREPRRGRDGERELQGEERGDLRTAQARVRGLGQADAADPARGPSRPVGEPGEPRA